MAEPDSILELIAGTFAPLEAAQNRYPVHRTGPREPIPPYVRLLVLKRDHFRCDWCGTQRDGQLLNLDHIVPWSAGGSDDTTNLRLLCPGCNERRSNYRTDATYTRRMPCTPFCLACMGHERNGITIDEFEPDERIQVFCGTCNQVTLVPKGDRYCHIA